MFLKVGETGLGLLTGIILARALGAGGYGYYAYAMVLVQIITIPMVMGLPQLIMRETAAYLARKDYGRMRGLLLRGNQFVLGASIFSAVAAAVLAIAFADGVNSVGLQTFLISLLLLPFLGIKSLHVAVLRGLRHVVRGLMPDLLFRPLIFILLLAAGLFLLPGELSPQLAMVFQLMATGLAVIILTFYMVRSLPIEAKGTDAVCETSFWLKSAMPFMLLGSINFLNRRVDIIMLGIFCPAEDVGIYRTVVTGAMLVSFVLTAVNMALAPVISGLYTENNMARLQQVITVAARAIFAGTLPIVLVLIFAGQWFLATLFGAEFGAGYNALRILCIGQLVNAGMGSVGYILIMTGREKYAVYGTVIVAIMNIVLNMILIPRFGLEGAATATAIGLTVWNVLLGWWAYKHVGIVSIAFKRLAKT